MTDDTVKAPALEFLSDADVATYEGWLKFQAIDLATLTEEEAAGVRAMFDDAVKRRTTSRKVGRMKLKAKAGESKYAVAIREGADLWLALWVRRSPKPEFFVFMPRGDGDWNPHNSLHADGTFHAKSYDHKMQVVKRQRPDSIEGAEHLGVFGGYGTASVGAICEPADFTGVLEAPHNVLGPRNGMVAVDLVEPGGTPLNHPAEEVARRLFDDAVPHVLIRIFRS